MHRLSILALCGAMALLLSASASAECLPQVREGWIRLSPGGMQMMLGGFARIENKCPVPTTITGARSAGFADVSLHRTSLLDGISRMRAVAQLPLPSNGVAVFEPGALHLMLMQPAKPLKAGDHVQVDFSLLDGRHFRGDFVVRAAGAQ